MTTPFTLRLSTGRDVTFDLPTPGAGPPLFALSVPKCGSTVFNNMIQAIGEANGYGYLGVGDTLFSQNVRFRDWGRDPAMATLLRPGLIFGGFREMPLAFADNQLFVDNPKALMIRDPRDALVSGYFSMAYTHPVPQPVAGHDDTYRLMNEKRAGAVALSLEKWVVQEANWMNETMMAYAPIVGSPTTVVLKYEDYIFEKDVLMRAVARHFGWEIDEDLVAQILQWADVRPKEENQFGFIRKVTPGDYKEKLGVRTIAALNRLLRPAMELFGYSRGLLGIG